MKKFNFSVNLKRNLFSTSIYSKEVAIILDSLEQKTFPVSKNHFGILFMFLALSKLEIFCLALPYPLIRNTITKSRIYCKQPILACINTAFKLSALYFRFLGMSNSINTLSKSWKYFLIKLITASRSPWGQILETKVNTRCLSPVWPIITLMDRTNINSACLFTQKYTLVFGIIVVMK